MTKDQLMKAKNEKGVLIAAHRGVYGGNIACNTPESYEAALIQGADIIELDVSISADGKLFAFHPYFEKAFLGSDTLIKNMHSSDVEKLRYKNYDQTETQFHVSYLRDVLKPLKGRCYINIDKFWTCMQEITDLVTELGIEDQVIIKTNADEKTFADVERIAPHLAYMPVISNKDNVTEGLLRSKLNLVGAEILFKSEDEPIASAEYVKRMHDNGLLLWVNSIVYNYKAVLTAGHNDDISITGDPDNGWGWLAQKGYDIIQTDWTLPAYNYYVKTGIRKA